MDACRASSCCHGVKNAPWTEVPVVPSARAMRAVPVPVPAAAVAVVAVPLPARGVPQRRWRLWISSLQRRLTRLSIRWTNELSPHSTTNHSIFSTGFPLTGKFYAHWAKLWAVVQYRIYTIKYTRQLLQKWTEVYGSRYYNSVWTAEYKNFETYTLYFN